MLSLENSSRIMITLEETILYWLASIRLPVKKLEQLSDGTIYLKLLELLPGFVLTQPVKPITDKSQTYQLRFRTSVCTMRVIFQSLKRYYQTKLLKDASKIGFLSMADHCAGNKKEIIRFMELLIGAMVQSEYKETFLANILRMEMEYQELFMILIKNSLAMVGEDTQPNTSRTNGSPGRARALLNRIEELQNQVDELTKKTEMSQAEMLDSKQALIVVSKQIDTLKKQKAELIEQLEEVRGMLQKETQKQKDDFELKVVKERLVVQKQSYEAKIKELQGIISRQTEEVQKLRKDCEELTLLRFRYDMLTNDLRTNQTQVERVLRMLSEKDKLLQSLTSKQQEYKSRILELELANEEMAAKLNMMHRNPQFQMEPEAPPSTFRVRTVLKDQLADVVQELTVENSQLRSELVQQKLQTEQQYEHVILTLKEKVRLLQRQLGRSTNKNVSDNFYGDYGSSTFDWNQQNSMEYSNRHGMTQSHKWPGSSYYPHSSTQNSMIKSQVMRTAEILQDNHQQQINLLLTVVYQHREQIETLQRQLHGLVAEKEQRKSQYVRRLQNMGITS